LERKINVASTRQGPEDGRAKGQALKKNPRKVSVRGKTDGSESTKKQKKTTFRKGKEKSYKNPLKKTAKQNGKKMKFRGRHERKEEIHKKSPVGPSVTGGVGRSWKKGRGGQKMRTGQ